MGRQRQGPSAGPFKFAVPGGGHVMVVLARGPGCPSRHQPARSHGFPIPADNFPNELARVCDSVGNLKSWAWRGLGAAFPSHFIMGRKIHCMQHGARSCARPGGQSCWALMPEMTARLIHGRVKSICRRRMKCRRRHLSPTDEVYVAHELAEHS